MLGDRGRSKRGKGLGIIGGMRVNHFQDALHDGMEWAMVGIEAWWELVHGEGSVGAKWSGIERASCTILTPIVSDGMECACGVIPGNWGVGPNADKCWGVIGGKGANGNMEGRLSSYRQRSDYQQADQQESKNFSFQWHRLNFFVEVVNQASIEFLVASIIV